jgi:hypothetical protein
MRDDRKRPPPDDLLVDRRHHPIVAAEVTRLHLKKLKIPTSNIHRSSKFKKFQISESERSAAGSAAAAASVRERLNFSGSHNIHPSLGAFAVLSLVTFHLHLLCDLAGFRGPSPEDLWPIFYFGPFDKDPMWLFLIALSRR